MKKLLILLALCMVFSVVMVACETTPSVDPETSADATEAPSQTEAETDAPSETETEVPSESETEAPSTTETEPPTTTEETTTEAPVDPVKVGQSFDECDMFIDGEAVGAFFAPGASATWDKIATVEDYNVQAIRIWGWVAFFAETPGTFGYQIGDAEPVFDEGFSVEAEQGVVDVAVAQGGKSAARMKIFVPVEYLDGEVVIKALVKDAVGTIEVVTEFTMTKPTNPNAPVFFVNASEMAASIPGSPDVVSAVMSEDNNYITITTGTTGDPYYQLPMINNKGYKADYIVIKYRTTVQEIGGQIFIGSGAGPNGQGDCPVFDYVADGKWHLAIIPLADVASITDAGINYLRWDMFQRGTDNVIDMGYIAAFQSAEAATAWDAQFADKYVDIINVPQDQWVISGHCPQIVGKEGHANSPMVAAGGIDSGALLHQGAVCIGEYNLAEYSKMIMYYGVDNSDITFGHYDASANNRFMITGTDTHLLNSPADEAIIASVDYYPTGWALTAIEIDLTGVDYNGPVYVSYDTLPGTFMLIGAIELVCDPNYVAPAPEGPSIVSKFDADLVGESCDSVLLNGDFYFGADGEAYKKLAEVNDTITIKSGDEFGFRGWIGFREPIESFGMQINGSEDIIWGEYKQETEAGVLAAGGENASRYLISLDTDGTPAGEYTVAGVAQLANGNIAVIHTVTVIVE